MDESICENSPYNETIPVIISNRNEITSETNLRGSNLKNLVTVKRNNKLIEASHLPVVVNLNPRSLYNKTEEFKTLIEQSEAGICCVSETWNRSHSLNSELITDLIEIEGYCWIKNPVQRNRKGGKPAILASTKEFHVTELSPNVISVPINIEIAWALLTPKFQSKDSRFRHIVVASVYYSSTQTKRADFLDHVCQSYQILCSKYGQNVGFIFAGDMNKLNLKPILNLSNDLRQVVTVPTRQNPNAILDKIITNLHSLYEPPYTLQPLDHDVSKSGAASDHLIVLMRPLSNSEVYRGRKYRIINCRTFPDSEIRKFGTWIQSQSWKEVYSEMCPTKKAVILEQLLMTKIEELFPMKSLKLNENDKPWVNAQLVKIDRRRKREYNRNKKSEKWKYLNELFLQREKSLKLAYNKKIVEDLKISNVSQWYSKLKRMSGMENMKEDKVTVEEFADTSSEDQVEIIADKFAQISNLYQPLKDADIKVPSSQNSKEAPLFLPHEIHEKIQKMKKKSSSVPGDIPWKIIREFSVELAEPLCNVYNSATLAGVWPECWKH